MTDLPNIPGFSLARQNTELREELLQVIGRVIDGGMFILGENVQALEGEIADYSETRFGIGVASGSDALYLSLQACGIGPGDEVITTPFTFFATAGAIQKTGARPVFVDIDQNTWNIDPNLIKQKITPQTRAIIPVHLYGCPADMDPIITLAQEHNLRIIDDAAQALGARYKGNRVGSLKLSDVACFSFFPTKNLGCFGDGGMVVTNDPRIAERVRLLRVHGAKPKYHHHVPGSNSRLDEVQAAVLRLKFANLEKWTKRRREIAQVYDRALSGLSINNDSINRPLEPDYAYHVYHQYTLQTTKRDELQAFLKERGVGSTVYYPVPMHLQGAFAYLGHRLGQYPLAEAACNQVLSLPMFPELTSEEAEYIARMVVDFFA